MQTNNKVFKLAELKKDNRDSLVPKVSDNDRYKLIIEVLRDAGIGKWPNTSSSSRSSSSSSSVDIDWLLVDLFPVDALRDKIAEQQQTIDGNNEGRKASRKRSAILLRIISTILVTGM